MEIQKDMGKKAQGRGSSLHGAPTGKPGRGSVYQGLNVLKKALETGTSLHTSPNGNHGGGVHLLGTLDS